MVCGGGGGGLPLLDMTVVSQQPWKLQCSDFPECVSKSVPVFCPHTGFLFTPNVCLMSPGWFEVQIGLKDSAAPDVCLVTLFILPHWASKTRMKTQRHEVTESVCKAAA